MAKELCVNLRAEVLEDYMLRNDMDRDDLALAMDCTRGTVDRMLETKTITARTRVKLMTALKLKERHWPLLFTIPTQAEAG